MGKIVRVLFILGALFFIFGNVYLAVQPSKQIVTHRQAYSKHLSKAAIQNITNFGYWKNWPVFKNHKIEVIENVDVLSKVFKIEDNSKKTVSIENYFISDTLVVQHIYGLGAHKASVLQWSFKEAYIEATFTLQLGAKEKILKKLDKLPAIYKTLFTIPVKINGLLKQKLVIKSKKESIKFRIPKQAIQDSMPNSYVKDSIVYIPKQQ